MIDGQVWQVSLHGAADNLLETLGNKAARNKSGTTTLAGGLIKVTAKKQGGRNRDAIAKAEGAKR
jgi:hypothetical protein